MKKRYNDLDHNPKVLELLSSVDEHIDTIRHHVKKQARGLCLADSKPECKRLIFEINEILPEISKIVDKAKEYPL